MDMRSGKAICKTRKEGRKEARVCFRKHEERRGKTGGLHNKDTLGIYSCYTNTRARAHAEPVPTPLGIYYTSMLQHIPS
jgi:hypothetical protein